MRSRLIELRGALVALIVVSSAACVIGPKQDDPASATPATPASDTGIGEFSDSATSSDTSGGKENDATIVADSTTPSDTAAPDATPSDTSVFDAPPSDSSSDVSAPDAVDVDAVTDASDVEGG